MPEAFPSQRRPKNSPRRVSLQVEDSSEVRNTVHIVERFAPGGIETLVHDIACRDPSSLVISLSGRVDALTRAWPRAAELKHRLEALDRPQRVDPQTVWRLSRLLKARPGSTIIAHHIGPLLYGGLACKLASLPVIYVEHDAWHYAQNKNHGRLLRALVAWVNPKLCAVSSPVAQCLRDLTKRDVTVVPPGICTKTFRPQNRIFARQRLGLPVGGRLIGAIGRLEAVKGHKHLIAAFAELKNDVRLVVAGQGTQLSCLRAYAEGLGVADRVYFLGHRENVSELYPAFDVLCQPSLAEGLPRTVLEAQACGIPVVASDVGGVRYALEPHNGKLVAAADETALAQALRAVLQADPDPLAIRQFVVERYSLESTMAVLNSLSGARS